MSDSMQTNLPKTIHKIARGWQVFFWICIPFLTSYMLSTAWIIVKAVLRGIDPDQFSTMIFLVFAVFFYGFTIFLSLSYLKVYAVTSPAGLEYHGIYIHIYTSWENTAQIALVGLFAPLGIGAKVIKLSQPPQIISSNWLGRLIFTYQEGISLMEFGPWRSSSLRAEISKYAPKLLA